MMARTQKMSNLACFRGWEGRGSQRKIRTLKWVFMHIFRVVVADRWWPEPPKQVFCSFSGLKIWWWAKGMIGMVFISCIIGLKKIKTYVFALLTTIPFLLGHYCLVSSCSLLLSLWLPLRKWWVLAWCSGGSSDDNVATDRSGNWSSKSWEKGLRSFQELISHIIDFWCFNTSEY